MHALFFGDSHTVGVGDPSGLGWVGRVVAATHAEDIPLVSLQPRGWLDWVGGEERSFR